MSVHGAKPVLCANMHVQLTWVLEQARSFSLGAVVAVTVEQSLSPRFLATWTSADMINSGTQRVAALDFTDTHPWVGPCPFQSS